MFLSIVLFSHFGYYFNKHLFDTQTSDGKFRRSNEGRQWPVTSSEL